MFLAYLLFLPIMYSPTAIAVPIYRKLNMKNVLEVKIYIKTEIAMKINSIIIGALMFMINNFLIKVIKFCQYGFEYFSMYGSDNFFAANQ